MRKVFLVLMVFGTSICWGNTPTLTPTDSPTPGPPTMTPTITPTMKTVYLEARVYDDFVPESHTRYIGTLPTGKLNGLKQRILNMSSLNLNIFTEDQTWITNEMVVPVHTHFENCQLSKMWTGWETDLRNNVINGLVGVGYHYTEGDGVTENNIIVSDGLYTERAYQKIYNNLFAFCDCGIHVHSNVDLGEEGDNIFYRNVENMFIGNPSAVQKSSDNTSYALRNYWFDSNGLFLTDEYAIIQTTQSQYLKVVPFQTIPPFTTSVSGWKHYE